MKPAVLLVPSLAAQFQDPIRIVSQLRRPREHGKCRDPPAEREDDSDGIFESLTVLLQVPDKYAARICNQIGMLGLRGRSVLFSSGDEGTGAVCRSNRPVGNLYGHPEFTPQFPSTCPYVTAVGGTQAYNPEVHAQRKK